MEVIGILQLIIMTFLQSPKSNLPSLTGLTKTLSS